MNKNFHYELLLILFKSLKNNHQDNYDFARFGIMQSKKFSLKEYLKRKFIEKKYIGNLEFNDIIKNIDKVLEKHTVDFERVFDMLCDENSKNIFLQLIAYKILGNKFVKLPLNTPEYWQKINEIEKSAEKNKIIDPHFSHFILYYFDLNNFGIPIKLYYVSTGIFTTFMLEQYYFKKETVIAAERGDIIIDAGACWGDSALFFASNAGDSGKVYSFDFIPQNKKIFNRNLDLNPELKNRITLIDRPLWSESNKDVYFIDNGPGSTISFDELNNGDGKVLTITIDDFVEIYKLDKIDFIKMDIEGAEQNALIGAEKTIRKFRPKLAISIYHSIDDMANIPQWINNLNVGYKLYLDHYTIHSEETVIYAKVL